MSLVVTRPQIAPFARTSIDPITVEVISSTLSSIAEEMGKTLIKSAYSDNIKMRLDCSTAIFDAKGTTLVQAEHIPLHLGSLLGMMDHILASVDQTTVVPGDVFIGNDAYEGGSTHLQDIVLAEPVFIDGELFGWVMNTAHHVDWTNLRHTHIFEEGLRIPPVRLYRAGIEQPDILKMILLNCQLPDLRVGDLRAQMACNRVGIERIKKVCAKYGKDVVVSAADAILDYSERKTAAALSSIPSGRYTYEAKFETDLIENSLDLKLSIDVKDGEIFFDFTGNPLQVNAPVNAILNGTKAMIYFAIKSVTDQDILPNSGFYRRIHVSAPEGSVFNARPPAPVYSRQDLLARMVDMIWAALAEAIPDKVIAGCSGGFITTLTGNDPATGGFFVHNETLGGGWGARSTKDGWDNIEVCCGNSMNMPIETLESEFPLKITRYELVQDSGGPGTFRGGMSIRRAIRPIGHDNTATIGASCQIEAPFGILGGHDGGLSVVERGEGVAPFVKRYGVIKDGHDVAVVTAGGGGFGDPKKRDRAMVIQDLREERISERAAMEVYGLTAQEVRAAGL